MRKILLSIASLVLIFSIAVVFLPVRADSQITPSGPVAFGFTASCTTNASGYCTVNHSLGAVPTTVQAQAINYVAIATTRNWTATSVQVRLAKRINSNNNVDPWPNITVQLTLVGMYVPGSTPEPSASVTPSVPTSASVTPSASISPSTPPVVSDYPTAANTGVPAGTVLTAQACTGDTLVVTADNTAFNSKTINCNVEVRAKNVVISKSKVTGSVYTPDGALDYSFKVEDSEVTFPTLDGWGRTMIGEANFTVLRTEITGGNRGIYCRKNCTVQDSWIHGTKVIDAMHASAIRVSQGAKLIHNTIHCDVPDSGEAGCSANITGYPDFESVKNNTVERNLLKATPGGFCAYGGATKTKPYSDAADNATNIIFKDNVFEKGTSSGKCGWWGPITDFDGSRPGNVWSGNKWDNGVVVNP